jgi:hypothetical protein
MIGTLKQPHKILQSLIGGSGGSGSNTKLNAIQTVKNI